MGDVAGGAEKPPRFRLWLIGCYLTFALALPYVTGAPFSYVLVLLSLILAIWGYARNTRVRTDPGAAMLLAAFSLLAIAFATTNRPGSTDYLFATNFVLFALFAPLIGALSRSARPNNIVLVSWLSLAGALLGTIVALIQVFVLHTNRAEGWGSDPTQSATVAMILGFVALAGYSSISDWRRNLLLLGPVLGIATVFLSGARGSFIALPALILVAIFLARVRPLVLISAAVLTVAGAVGFFLLKPDIWQRYTVLQDAALQLGTGKRVDADLSTGIRYRILEGSLDAFKESPWIGYGWNGKIPAVRRFIDVVFPDDIHSHLHSDLLNFGVAAGVVGLVAYLLAVFAPLISGWTSPRDSQYIGRRYAATILTLGYFFCGIVNMLFGFEYLTTFFISVAAILIGYCRDEPSSQSVSARQPETTALARQPAAPFESASPPG